MLINDVEEMSGFLENKIIGHQQIIVSPNSTQYIFYYKIFNQSTYITLIPPKGSDGKFSGFGLDTAPDFTADIPATDAA